MRSLNTRLALFAVTIALSASVLWAAAAITSITPGLALVGSASTPITVTGQNLAPGSSVIWTAANGQAYSIAPSAIQSAQLSATIPASLLTSAGTGQVSIADSLGNKSNQLPFHITPFTITGVTPNNSMAGAAATSVTVAGQNITSGSTLAFTPPNGSTVFIAPTLQQASQLAATVPAALLTSAGTAQVAIANAAGATTNPLPFNIYPFLVSSVSPAIGIQGNATQITVTGTKITAGSALAFTPNGGSTYFITADSMTSSQLVATIPASLLTLAGAAQIAIVDPVGALSNQLAFNVVTVSISYVTPYNALVGTATRFTIAGQYFTPGSLIAFTINGVTTNISPDSLSPTQIVATVPASLLTSTGTGTLAVVSSNGTTTNVIYIPITQYPPPTVDSVTPNSGAGISQTFAFKFSSDGGAAYIATTTMVLYSYTTSYIYCDVSYSAQTNTLKFYDSTGSRVVETFTPGTAGSFSNGVCTVNGASSRVTRSGKLLEIDLPITFSNTLQTGFQINAYVEDIQGLSLLSNVGSWLPNINNTPLHFVPISPCRLTDTRNAPGAFGGPSLAAGTSRDFSPPAGLCGIPASAEAYSLAVAVVPSGPLGYLTVWPAGQPQPLTATLNSDGRVKSNAAIVAAGANRAFSVYATNPTDVIVDINGYFTSATDPGGLVFFPVLPCRISDTRNANGPFGGPYIAGQSSRTIPMRSSACNLPATAQAYSVNLAAVPRGPLGYLTAWPTGQPQPFVSTLNAPTGTVTAEAAIIPAGNSGSFDVFATNDTDLVIDINGYFAPQTTGGLSLYTVPPCRAYDSRLPSGTATLPAGFKVSTTATTCGAGTASPAQAYLLNATVVPPGPFGYLTLWAQGAAQPFVSSLNATDGAVTGNMVIVPASPGGISFFGSNASHVILDLFGYFAP